MAKRRVKRMVARGVLATAHANRVRRTAKKVREKKLDLEGVEADIREEVRRRGRER